MQNWVYVVGERAKRPGVDNAKSGICYIYVYLVRMHIKLAGGDFFPLKTQLFRLDPTFF